MYINGVLQVELCKSRHCDRVWSIRYLQGNNTCKWEGGRHKIGQRKKLNYATGGTKFHPAQQEALEQLSSFRPKNPTFKPRVLHSNRRALGRKRPGAKQLSVPEAKLKVLTDGGCLLLGLLRLGISAEEKSEQFVHLHVYHNDTSLWYQSKCG